MRNLDWTRVLEKTEALATCEIVKELIRKIQPCRTADEARQIQRDIDEARQILRSGIRPHMESLDLFRLWYERLTKKATLKPIEFKDVRLFCIEVLALKEALKVSPKSWSRKLTERLMDSERPLSAIEQVLTPQGEVRNDASQTLYRLFNEKQELERNIRTTLDRLVKQHEMENFLQERYVTNREGRWVLPIRSGMRHGLEGIIHDTSHTKQTVFMEPQAVVTINNRLREVESSIEEEIERLLKELSEFLSQLTPHFDSSKQALIEADLRFAQAQFAEMTEALPCDFSSTRLHLRDLRHPILCLQLGTAAVVSNTVTLDHDYRVLVLSGPNAGGKTVLLKAVGLAAQMARCGLPICAAVGSEMPFFENIMAAVGDSQSVDQHLSTFAAHLKLLTEGLSHSGIQSLVLVDEICGSTDPEEGAALARSFIESYVENNVMAVITSHLGPLKEGWDKSSHVLTGSMDFNDAAGSATYHLILGVHGRSLAIATAKKVGVPLSVVNRALDLISPEARAREERLAELENQKQELQKQKNELAEQMRYLKEDRHRYQQLVARFKADREKWMEKSLAKTEAKINLILEEIKKDKLKTKSLGDFKSQLPQIIKSPQIKSAETAADFAKLFPAGSAVYVRSLGQDGVVQGAPNNRGEVPILSNSMRLFLPWTELSSPQKSMNQNVNLARKSGIVTLQLQDEDRQIDLRGYRVEEALELLETQLDLAVRNKEERIKIIHGHGTEALKKAVRMYFSRSVYVKKWKQGDAQSGGDGITWVELSD